MLLTTAPSSIGIVASVPKMLSRDIFHPFSNESDDRTLAQNRANDLRVPLGTVTICKGDQKSCISQSRILAAVSFVNAANITLFESWPTHHTLLFAHLAATSNFEKGCVVSTQGAPNTPPVTSKPELRNDDMSLSEKLLVGNHTLHGRVPTIPNGTGRPPQK